MPNLPSKNLCTIMIATAFLSNNREKRFDIVHESMIAARRALPASDSDV
jgi:hypothetical protein